MHELAVCQALLTEVERVSREHGGARVVRVAVRIGPLSGTEPELLQRAFEFARVGTVAADAELRTETSAVRVRCLACNAESEVAPNRLLCSHCGGWRTQLVTGDELQLKQVELRADVLERGLTEEVPPCATPAAAM